MTKSRTAGTSTYTPGNLARPHPRPKLVTPTWSGLPAASRTKSGPPLSPWQVSRPRAPAQSIVFGLIPPLPRYAFRHAASVTIGTFTSRRSSEGAPPVSFFRPKPSAVASRPGA